MNIGCIPCEKYRPFAQKHFAEDGKTLPAEVFQTLYNRFEGITWYVQRILNELFAITSPQSACTTEMVDIAIGNILRANEFTYQSMLFQLPPKQKELLIAPHWGLKNHEFTDLLNNYLKQHNIHQGDLSE